MKYEEALKLLRKYGQEQLLEYYGELSQERQEELLAYLGKIDFSVLKGLNRAECKPLGKLTPADMLTLEQIAEKKEKFERVGLSALREGKVAAVLLAGGQGSRLGSDAPKGAFNIGLTRELSIFACQMVSVKSVAERAGRPFHLFIMTSEINDAQTRAFFAENSFFGYDADKVHFFVQDTTPVCSTEGKILLEEKYKPAFAPNGNGGWYASLRKSGYGKLLESEGIEWLNLYGVDNVLQKICDPAFIGATVLSGVACSGKVVRKTDPEERVGILCKEDGRPTVVEYYEMPEELKSLRDGDGQLTFRSGVILNYLFSVQSLNAVSGDRLPYHLAKKKVAYIRGGKKITPEEPNAYKFELLALDQVRLMEGCLAFEVEREKEFAPVKNATGADSVESARALLVKNGVSL